MNRKDPEYTDFKEQFWEWFDTLPQKKKEMFWRYKDDMAETNFYFTVYSKKSVDKQKFIV
jgi:hypothetical protein